MTEEMHGFEEDGGVREAHPLYQENQALRERLMELTKQLAESEEQRIALVQKMYDPRCLAGPIFAMSNMKVRNQTESELTRIRDENDSLKRVMSETSLDSYVGRADPTAVDAEAAMESSEKESTEGRIAPHVRVGMSCEEEGAADVHIANDVALPQSDGSARGEITMTPIPPVRDLLKGESRSGQLTPPENPISRNHDADILQSSSMSRRMQHGTPDDGDDAESGSSGPGWRGDPVRTTTESDPSVSTAEATNRASPEIPNSASSCEHTPSVEVQGSTDDPMDDTAVDLMEGISTVSTPSSPETTTAQSRTGRSVRSWASEEDGEHLTSSRLPSPNQGSGAVFDKPTAALDWGEDGPTRGVEGPPALPEPFQTASVASPASHSSMPAAESIPEEGTGSPTSLSRTFNPPMSSEASIEGQLEPQEETSAVHPVPSPFGEISHRYAMLGSTSQDTVAAESVPIDMLPPIAHSGDGPPTVTTPLSPTSHGRAISSPELPLGGTPVQTESRKTQFSPPDKGVSLPGLREPPSSAASEIRVASPIEATVTVQTRLDDVSPPIVGSHVGDSDSASCDELSSPLVHKTSRRLKTPKAGPPASKPPKAGTRERPMGSMIDDTGAKGIPHRRERPEDTIRTSYAKFGLDASRLIITHEPHTTHPLALYMGSTAKTQSELTRGRSKKLCSARDDLLAYIPAAGDSGADRKNMDLIRRLGLSPTAEEGTLRLVDVVKALGRRSDVAADELNLFRCLEGLAVMVVKHHNEAEVKSIRGLMWSQIADVRSIAKRWKAGVNTTSSASTSITA
ncbi:hypothetical protein LTS09_016488 [Friedmanniomyces endolithicus]|nr:hypothetical protein LTS09_016488 [Friedmanniomyces endolithicus]